MSERSINDMPESYIPTLDLKENYMPSEKDEYMCDEHIEFFRRKLIQWQDELEKESQETIHHLQGEVRDIGDEAERASRETENTLELRTRDRYRKLLSKIRKALVRIQEGDYGYCEDTDEEIGLKRLMARPIATMTIDAQERWELRQKLLKEGR
ncbi:MAG: RNA polymerase-binding protein DksA [Marinicellaceae bacterium]